MNFAPFAGRWKLDTPSSGTNRTQAGSLCYIKAVRGCRGFADSRQDAFETSLDTPES